MRSKSLNVGLEEGRWAVFLTDPFFSAPQTRGSDGSVSGPAVKSGALEAEDKQSYPVDLLEIMRRQAEDLLLSNSGDQKGREALEFIKRVTDEITTDENAQRINKCKPLGT